MSGAYVTGGLPSSDELFSSLKSQSVGGDAILIPRGGGEGEEREGGREEKEEGREGREGGRGRKEEGKLKIIFIYNQIQLLWLLNYITLHHH